MEGFRPCRTAALGLALAAGLLLPAVASAAVPPLDPQQVEDQQNMTFEDYKPIPGVDWATNGAVPTSKKVTIALVAFDFPDQPFVITQPKKSDPFGNPQIDPVPRADVPKFYADFYNTPNALNKGHTINGYWMEQSGGKVGITDVKTYGPYRMPKKLYQYGAQRHRPGAQQRSSAGARRTRPSPPPRPARRRSRSPTRRSSMSVTA